MDGGMLVAAVIGGMLCGVLVTAGLVLGYFLTRQQPKLLPPLLPVAKSPKAQQPDFPPPPERRSESDVEAGNTLPPDADLQRYRTFEHRYDSASGTPWLDGIGGMVVGQRIKISRAETLIGRSRVCDVQLHDPKVSRQHALLRLYQGRYFLQDMQSSRGTLVNNRRVQTHMLQDGDEIRLGDSVVIFRMPDRSPDYETKP
jgi:hypothetical protein